MKLSVEEAFQMLPEKKDRVRTLRQLKGSAGYLATANYSKKFLKTLMKKYGVYKAGDLAKTMNYGLVVEDENGQLFIETKYF